jgi:hypothetical protein
MQDSVPAALLQKWKTFTVYFGCFMRIEDVLLPALLGQMSGSAADWFQSARDLAATGSTRDLLRVYPQASRYLGRQPFVSPQPDSHSWHSLTLEDVGRLLLLTARYRGQSDEIADADAAAVSCFEEGDSREQQSWMRTVAWLPHPEHFLPLVIDTCGRTSCRCSSRWPANNVYPSRYFPDRNFNQVVLKAMFNGVALSRIVGLQARRNAELSRMASDLRRRAASGGTFDSCGYLARAARPSTKPGAALRRKGPTHEDHRPARPHDVAHDRRLRSHGRRRHRGDRRARLLAGTAADDGRQFVDYFNSLLGWERFRASQFGIRHFCTMGLNPKEANNPRSRTRCIDLLPRYLVKDGVVAVGEIGFDDQTDAEETFFARQVELRARIHCLSHHTPHRDKKQGTDRSLQLVRSLKFPRSACSSTTTTRRRCRWCSRRAAGPDTRSTRTPRWTSTAWPRW